MIFIKNSKAVPESEVQYLSKRKEKNFEAPSKIPEKEEVVSEIRIILNEKIGYKTLGYKTVLTKAGFNKLKSMLGERKRKIRELSANRAKAEGCEIKILITEVKIIENIIEENEFYKSTLD